MFDIELNRCIHILSIIPGSSHWFQVHDQQPFAILKKTMEEKKIDISQDISLVSDERRKLLMGLFYEAESKAINNEIVRKSFDDVGSWS